jgi:YfiH family protein
MNEKGFVLRSVNGVSFYSCLALENLPQVRHGFSTRMQGADSPQGNSLNLSKVPWDTHERVSENRSRFLSALGLASTPLVTLSQIHSDRIHLIDDAACREGRRRDGDALITRRTGTAVGVLVADCFPILLADPDSGAVAAVHSGWRGTTQRILEKTIREMRVVFGSRPSALRAAIGPGIRSCCFEVGTEVAEDFEEAFAGARLSRQNPERSGKYMLDLARALEIQCVESGLDKGNTFDLGICTRCHPEEFFSYRAEGHRAGRLMALIAITTNDHEGTRTPRN